MTDCTSPLFMMDTDDAVLWCRHRWDGSVGCHVCELISDHSDSHRCRCGTRDES